MKCQSLLLCLLGCSFAESASNPYRRNLELLLQEPSSGAYSKHEAAQVEELWMTQKLDHFDEANNQTWQMRYLRNAKYHRPLGPIYIFVGGEWTISPGFLSTGLTHDMAVENGGMLYYTEHRYYGKSWPLGNDSLSQLEYLSVRQALADLAHFISYQKSHSAHLANAKVILVGGSYSGSMVAWMADLYPELIEASWASSAPLLAKADFNEYMEIVSNSINLSYGPKCTQRIRRGLQYLAHILNGNESREILEQLNACPNFNYSDQLDRAAFFNGIDNYFALIVQSYSSYIPDLCETLMSLHPTDEQAMFKFLQLLYGRNGSNCLDFSYKAMLQLFTDLSDQNSGSKFNILLNKGNKALKISFHTARAWFFQTCNEFGWYTTTAGSGSSDFANQVPLLFFECLCRDAFGRRQTAAHLTDGIAQTNAQFGGLNFNQTVRYRQVFFTHGELDPWRALGKQFGHQALLIPGYSHCEDLGSINVGQSIPMNLAKLRVMSFLRRHLYSQLH